MVYISKLVSPMQENQSQREENEHGKENEHGNQPSNTGYVGTFQTINI